MSSTGYWIVGAAPSHEIEVQRQAMQVASFEPLPESAGLGWWAVMDRVDLLAPAPGYTEPGPSEAARRFAHTLEAQRPDPEARDALLHAFEGVPQASIWHVGVRKGDPVAALYYGLGYSDAQLLPGRFGCFLLSPEAVRACLAKLEHLPEQPAVGREQFAERAAAWLEAVSDEPDLDPSALLEGPLRILRHARELRLGAIGFMQWY
jgi:hypothetical protein